MRPGCGCCACSKPDRFNVKELTGILGLAQSGVSRHLGLLKEAGLVVEERDGAYSFYRPRAGAARPLAGSALAVARRPVQVRVDLHGAEGRRCAVAGSVAVAPRELRARGTGYARWPSAGAGTQLGGVVARARHAAAAARGRRPGVRRRLPDGGNGALGQPGDRGRSSDRRAVSRQGARGPQEVREHHLEERRARKAADREQHHGCRAALAGVASRVRSGAGPE